MFSVECKTVKFDKNVFCLYLPCFFDPEFEGIESYFRDLLLSCCEMVAKEGFFGEGEKICFITDITKLDDKVCSGILMKAVYKQSLLCFFDCYPFALNVKTAKHIPLSCFVPKKQKNIPYCLMGNTVYSVNNCFMGEGVKINRKNLKSLISFIPLFDLT